MNPRKTDLEKLAQETGKRAKSLSGIYNLLDDNLYYTFHIGSDSELFAGLLIIAEESFRKTQETRKKNNARSRARHDALSSCGLKRNRNGSYE